MALTGRYPDGQALTYNRAMWLEHGNGEYVLRENKDGQIVATIQASAGVIVEFIDPCKIENPLAAVGVKAAANYLMDFAQGAHDYATNNALADLKRRLRHFDAKTRSWRKS